MNLDREQRDQLKALSTEIFGVSSKYQKMFEYDEVVSREVEEVVPGENGQPDTTRKVRVPVLTPSGAKQSVRKYRTFEEVLEILQSYKAKRDEFLKQMEEQKAAAKAKKEAEELAKKVQDDLGGSALK